MNSRRLIEVECAAKLELYGRYLMVEDDGECGGINVSFTGIYVRMKSLKRPGKS